jgi:hypothetical protein
VRLFPAKKENYEEYNSVRGKEASEEGPLVPMKKATEEAARYFNES